MTTNRQRAAHEARVVYDAESERIDVALGNGGAFSFPVSLVPSVQKATPKERAAVRLSSTGTGLRWDPLDLDLYWPYLTALLFGSDAWTQGAAQALGRMTSVAKARAARANGAKGGRPRKRAKA